MTIFGANETSDHTAATEAGRSLGWIRLGIGVVQGLALYLLYLSAEVKVWPSTVEPLFVPLILVMLFTPVTALGGVGRFRPRILLLWLASATAITAIIGWWAGLNELADGAAMSTWFGALIFPAGAALLFILHHLILAADITRRRIAPYPVYFDTAWKAGVQLALSAAFTGAFWLLLLLGSGLFGMIGLDFLRTLIGQEWFSIPATTLAFAAAVHLTDVKDGLIRGVRTVALMLLSWLLPVMAILTAGFIAALPFAGVGRLWEAGYGTNLMLAAAAALIILINAGYQDGEPDGAPHVVLRWTARLAGVLLVPLMGLALWGMALRIGQHGLTPERIIALTLVLLGVIYAGGYAFAAVRPGPWMRPLERVNVIAAVATVAAILALFTPIADPLRLSVGDQMRRLETGRVSAEDFDYGFLQFRSGQAGKRALARLAESDDPIIARQAADAIAADDMSLLRDQLGDVAPRRPLTPDDIRIEVVPEGSGFPQSFSDQLPELVDVLGNCQVRSCIARVFDVDDDGQADVLIARRDGVAVFQLGEDGRWILDTVYEYPFCSDHEKLDLRHVWANGDFDTPPAQYPDMRLGAALLRAQGNVAECPLGETLP